VPGTLQAATSPEISRVRCWNPPPALRYRRFIWFSRHEPDLYQEAFALKLDAVKVNLPKLRNLIVVLGDQLDLDASAYDGFDARVDAAWMAEVADESTHVWSSRPRTVIFLAAMRHFALALKAADRPLHYARLDASGNRGSLAAQLQGGTTRLPPSAPHWPARGACAASTSRTLRRGWRAGPSASSYRRCFYRWPDAATHSPSGGPAPRAAFNPRPICWPSARCLRGDLS